MDPQIQPSTPVLDTSVSATIPHERELARAFPMPAVVGFISLALFAGAFCSSRIFPQHTNVVTTRAATASVASAFTDISINARAAIVYDARQQRILFEKNANAQLPLASLTKLMLALVAFETLPNDVNIVITPQALSAEGDSGLTVGEIWHLQDLIDATLIPSSNDGAQALALSMSDESTTRAVLMMNRRARELGLESMYFVNPTGLDESPTMAGAYASAKDVALLLAHLAQYEQAVLDGTSRDGMLLTSESGITHEAVNTNEALGQIPGMIGGKTGYTRLAGGNLAIAFDSSVGHPIIVVVLGSTESGRFYDVRALVNAARTHLSQSF